MSIKRKADSILTDSPYTTSFDQERTKLYHDQLNHEKMAYFVTICRDGMSDGSHIQIFVIRRAF